MIYLWFMKESGSNMVNHHLEAWNKVKTKLFGSVCEVTRTKPWGFYMHDPEIKNLTIQEFLESEERFGTVIMHILQGEGENPDVVKEVYRKAHECCVKLVILEHDPNCEDFEGLPNIFWMTQGVCKLDNWGRNLMVTKTTMTPLELPELSDEWLKKELNKSFVEPHDCGIDKEHLIYVTTSESKIDFELPKGLIYWVAGGGLCLESMKKDNTNIVFDPVLRQVLWIAHRVGVEEWKLRMIYPSINTISSPDYLPQTGGSDKHWRRVEWNGVVPNLIIVKDLKEYNFFEDSTIYVSSVHEDHWKHLKKDCSIIDAWTTRDKPRLI
jgi:hypothetical protein